MNSGMKILGIMSGSSMDGMDVAYCEFKEHKNKIEYKILKATTFSYPEKILQILQNIRNTSAKEFFEHDVIYGKFIGKKVSQFLQKNKLKADAVAVHGHTVFHHPEKGFSVQAGNAYQIASLCKIPVIHNFRNADIALGGQGAPLVPIGDRLLFQSYDACINIGGIANVFIQKNNLAYDICIANMSLNYFALQLGAEFDKNGNIAKSGKIHLPLLNKLNYLNYIHKKPPKSLNREYFENNYLPVIQQFKLPVQDVLSTLTEHIAFQISKSIQDKHIQKILITGGGAFNLHLIKRIKEISQKEIIVPDKTLVKYKEALIFALLGYLRLKEKHGNIKEATGAMKNTFCGEIVII